MTLELQKNFVNKTRGVISNHIGNEKNQQSLAQTGKAKDS